MERLGLAQKQSGEDLTFGKVSQTVNIMDQTQTGLSHWTSEERQDS